MISKITKAGSLLCLFVLYTLSWAGVQSYTMEKINDRYFATIPPPAPVHVVAYEYTITNATHTETIPVTSTNVRNVSIKLENTGKGLIRAPYLYSPYGWDFRNCDSIARTITKGCASDFERFVKVHEWVGMISKFYLPTSGGGYVPIRILNQYGGQMCGPSAAIVAQLLRKIPTTPRMYGRNCSTISHEAGEAWFDGAWHNYESMPPWRFIFYDYDNQTIPGWEYLAKQHPDLIERVAPWTGWNIRNKWDGGTFSSSDTDCDFELPFNFIYDLRPDESFTMYFDMRGRFDSTTIGYDGSGEYYRHPSDYGSAVFTYKPNLRNDTTYKQHVMQENNITHTAEGLVPTNPSQPSSLIIGVKSVWCMVGGAINAGFKTTGKVYVAINNSMTAAAYPTTFTWQELQAGQLKDKVIEGKMGYAVKFEFQGDGSGLDSVEISTEVQVNPRSMPGLEYGNNYIRFEAADMGGSNLKVTYRYDDQSPFWYYEPATSNYGRHISYRIGGDLEDDNGRTGKFWQYIKGYPNGTMPMRVEIWKVSGTNAGTLVRTLVNSTIHIGVYKWYWDGKDDSGNLMPVGMYCFKVIENGKAELGGSMYLYPQIWPIPNEQRGPVSVLLPPKPYFPPEEYSASPDNAQVRIYSVYGSLIKILDANGSSFNLWDGTNQYGEKVPCGIYYMISNKQKQKAAKNIAVLR